MYRSISLFALTLLMSATACAASSSTAWPAWRTTLCKDGPALVHAEWKHDLYAVPTGVSRIMLAAFEGRTADMRHELTALPAKDRVRWRLTALVTAAEGNQAETVQALIADGADPNARDWSPPLRPQRFRQITNSLARDKRLGGTRGVRTMQKLGLLDNRGEYLPPPLFEVMLCNQVDVARTLLENGASVHATLLLRGHRHGSDPLLSAVIYDNEKILAMLLAHGADTCHDDRRMAAHARKSGRHPALIVASIARKEGMPSALVARLRCPAARH